MDQNNYLNECLQQQARVEDELKPRQLRLKAKIPLPAQAPTPAGAVMSRGAGQPAEIIRDVVQGSESDPVLNYRITGFWRWKTVVVSPNAYVVHTRRGHAEPLHVGMGLSFRYDPATDAFLVIPAVVQIGRAHV